MSLKQLGDERYGDDAAQGGDERHLRYQRRVASVLEAEHGAETCHRHGDDHGVDLVDEWTDTTQLEEEIKAQGDDRKAQYGGDIDFRGSDNLLDGQLCHAGTDDHQGCRYGDVAHHRYWTGDDVGSMYAECYHDRSLISRW